MRFTVITLLHAIYSIGLRYKIGKISKTKQNAVGNSRKPYDAVRYGTGVGKKCMKNMVD